MPNMLNISALFSLLQWSGQKPLANDATQYAPFTSSFGARVKELQDEWHTPGIAIGVVYGDDTWTKGYGVGSIGGEPVTSHTLFYLASTTKSFTASAAALLVDNSTYKDIEWQTPMHDILGNDFVLQGQYETSHITIEDALSHRTGMPRHDFVWTNRDLTHKESTRRSLRHLPASAELRTKWQYCNLMYTAVAHVLEVVTCSTLKDVFTSWLWEPLGMSETYLDIDDALECRDQNPDCKIAQGYDWDEETSSFAELAWDTIPKANGAGGITSNVNDYTKWMRALMEESGPVPVQGHHAIKEPLSIAEAPSSDMPWDGVQWYGMGLVGSTYRGERVFHHSGGLAGFVSNILFLPDRKWGVVTMQNAPNMLQDVLYWRLIDDFLQTPESECKDLNQLYHKMIADGKEAIKSTPSKLFPEPRNDIPPALEMSAYEGPYLHPAYGNLTLVPGKDTSSSTQTSRSTTSLVARTRYLNGVFVFTHVSGEHWLVEVQLGRTDKKVPDGYTKARFDIGADGKVLRLAVVAEPLVEGEKGWIWFDKVK